MTQLAAETLGLPIEHVHFELGDADMPKAPVHGGSITLVSVGNTVVAACNALREKVQALSSDVSGSGYGAQLRRHDLQSVAAIGKAEPGDETENYSSPGSVRSSSRRGSMSISVRFGCRASSVPMMSGE